MTTRYVQPGQVLQHTAAAAITAGDVVQVGKLTGVALATLAIGQTGSIQIEGVFSVPKKAGDAFAQGDFVLFDNVAKNFKIGNGGPGCVAFAPALAADTTMLVKFTGVPGAAA